MAQVREELTRQRRDERGSAVVGKGVVREVKVREARRAEALTHAADTGGLQQERSDVAGRAGVWGCRCVGGNAVTGTSGWERSRMRATFAGRVL